MASVTATGNIANVNVSATISNISVTDTLSNVVVSNIASQIVNVAVTSTATTVNVAPLATVAAANIRAALSATTTAGSLGSLTYSNVTGVFNLNGPFDTDVRASVGNTFPITYSALTGTFGLDSSASFIGKTTSDLSEGTNLYYTTDRANSAIGAYTGSLDNLTSVGATTGNITTLNSTTVNATDVNTANITTTGQLTFRDANLIIRDNRASRSPEIIFIGEDTGNNANAAFGNLFLSRGSVLSSNVSFGLHSSGLAFKGNVEPRTSGSILRLGVQNQAEILLDKNDGIEILADQDLVLKGAIHGAVPSNITISGTTGNTDFNLGQSADFRINTDPGGFGLHTPVLLDANSQGNSIILNRGHFSSLDSGLHLMSSPAGFPNAGTTNDPVFIHADTNVGDNIVPKNLNSNSKIQVGTSTKSFYKTNQVNSYHGRLLLANSSSFLNTIDLPGRTSKGAVLWFTNDYDSVNDEVYLKQGYQINTWDTSANSIELDGGSSYILNTKADFTGAYKLTGNVHSDGSLSSNSNITSTQSVVGGYLHGDGSNITNITGHLTNAQVVAHIATVPLTVGGNLTVNGNINATGNINYENVVDLNVQDQEITLNSNAITDATVSIIANRPVAGNNTILRWNETSDIWEFTNDGSTFYAIPTSTTDLAEGTNLYYTDSRFDTRFATKTTSDLTEGTNLYYTTARANSAISAYTGSMTNLTGNITTTANISGSYILGNGSALTGIVADLSGKTTDDLAEGSTNLYYTTDRANTAIGAYQGNINTAGTITATGDITTSGFFKGDLDGAVTADVYNATGSTLTKGQAVYLTGVNTGDNPHVALADADDATKMPALGIVYSNIANASVGQVTTSGVMNFASHGFALGSDLFIGTTAGGLSITAPTGESGLIQKIGKVVSSNHIIVQGAFRTNATPNLNQGKIFLGDTNNQTLSVTPSTNFKTTGNAFEIANALTNVNSIQSESANDKFTFKALLGGAATETNTGNITSDGYEVIIDSSHTYASSGNVAQKSGSTNNLNGYAVSGSFTSGSTVFSITGVTELKNVFNDSGSIDGTNNNVSLTGDMVANMIPDNYDGVDGDQYPLPQGTVLSSANTTALVFSQAAVASQTFANTDPIAIVHGGRDTTTGQLISFVSQDDAIADGTANASIGAPADGGFVGADQLGQSPATQTVVLWAGGAEPSIPDGTALTFSGVQGPGNANINGQTFYSKVNSAGAFAVDLYSDAGLTTRVNTDTLGIVDNFDSSSTGSGIAQYSVAQSTATISKARLYKKDTYGYPKVGPKEQDFTYTVGSASDYTIDFSAATTSTRGRTSLEATKQVLKAPIGLTIGNATMSNRGDNDAFTNFGINQVWDGKTPYGSEYAGSSNTTLVPQMLFKNYTDNTFASGSSGSGRGGPRLFFASSTGNIDTNEFAKYPRKSQEIGRMTFWGPTQDVGDSMSTVNPAGFISATAHADWTSSNKLEMGFVANGHGFNNGDVFLKYIDGKVVLAGGHNGSTYKGIHFAPAEVTTNGNIAQTYATLGHTWANVNYANVSANTGSKLSVTQGGADGTSSGDVTFSIDRDYIPSTVTQTVDTPSNGGFIAGSEVGDTPNDVMVAIWAGGASHTIADGTAISFTGVTGPGNANINGTTFYSKTSPNLGVNATQLYLDSGLSTIANVNVIGIGPAFDAGGTGNGTAEWTETGTSARDYTFNLPTGSENLVLSTNGTTHSTFYSNGNLDVAGAVDIGGNATIGNISVEGINTTGLVTPANLTLSKFAETVHAKGNISGAVSFDMAQGSIQYATVTGDITSLGLSNDRTGTSATFILTQDGTGGHTMAPGASWKWAGGEKTLSTAAGAIDVISVVTTVVGGTTTYYASLTKGYAT